MDGLEDKINALFSSPESMAQIKKLAESLSGGATAASVSTAGADSAGTAQSSPLSGLDPKLMMLLMNAIKEYSTPGETAKVIAALRPYLRGDKADRLDKAMSIARIARAAKNILPEIGGSGHV